ncbi:MULTISPECIES: TlpA family protein disulfide reductase [Pedobacter]|uniref:Redoxin domain protein n=1 Tax=Pedobacter heparinus (strain ATCC 13125 / DSM 2366 / CIP 104194 / JCM 7457 / NBRC 12017 / NCIMB 9290 / NRRL B-14731 / HIM 762-3) TaxID=485917 RepID=C6XXN3_PEDHD|nr:MULTISPECIES: TlpA disulfide reductase family protein [Pedobacter]ACU02287.1 Redoxin domain protein [Pedobacter heparinus DSM 2366]MBB5437090.1 thiol-disulfide isomerase/thioredoxin [Pedobacter sp. AK017]
MEKIFNKKNGLNILFIAIFLVLIFVPAAKALMIRGLMEIGLFRPDVAQTEAPLTAAVNDLSGIRFKDAAGKEVDLGSLRGKVVFINFWATWCPPCLAEMPAVNKLYSQFKEDKGVVFILVDADSDFAKAQQYMDRKGYKMPVYNAASPIPEAIFKGSLPTTLVFDKKGRVAYNEVGAANYGSEKFIEFLKKLKASNI